MPFPTPIGAGGVFKNIKTGNVDRILSGDSLTAYVSGMATVRKNIMRFAAGMHLDITNSMKRALLTVMRDAKRFCPVDTGRLRASGDTSITAIRAEFIEGQAFFTADYAGEVHEGMDGRSAQPFLLDAVMANYDKIISELSKGMNKPSFGGSLAGRVEYKQHQESMAGGEGFGPNMFGM